MGEETGSVGEGSLYLVTEIECVCKVLSRLYYTCFSFFFSFLSCGAALCTLSRSLYEAWSSWLGAGRLAWWEAAAAVFRFFSSFPHEPKKPSPPSIFFPGAAPVLPPFLRHTCEGPASLTAPQPPPSLILSLPRPASFYLTYRSSTTVVAVYCNQ